MNQINFAQTTARKIKIASPAVTASPRVLVIAGEASSDFHAAELIRELKTILPDVEVFGMGGTALRRVGVETIVDSEVSASVMGLTEVVGSSGKILNALRILSKAAVDRKPDLAILVDYPDFNLTLAPRLHRAGIPILYFISPQLWAWRRGRIHKIKRYIRKVATIFPFEQDFYRQYGVDAEFVGNPLTEHFPVPGTREEICSKYELPTDQQIVALLPGSRKSEIKRLLQPMVEAAEILHQSNSDLFFVVPVAPGLDRKQIAAEIGERPFLKTIAGGSRELLSVAHAAVVASGTATVETALARVPFVAVYRLSPLTYRVARLLVRGVKNFAMANLICGEKVVEELLQDQVNGLRIAEEIKRLIDNPSAWQRVRDKLGLVDKRLRLPSPGTAGTRAAAIAANLIVEGKSRG